MVRHSPQQKLKEAKQIAYDHGLLVIEKADKFLLYRKMATRNVFIGERGSPAGIRTLVCKAANFH